MELNKPLLANSDLTAIPALGELMLLPCGLRPSPKFIQHASCYIGEILFDYGI
jgi:hypothetical protein